MVSLAARAGRGGRKPKKAIYLVNGPRIIISPVEEVSQLRDEVLVIPYDLL